MAGLNLSISVIPDDMLLEIVEYLNIDDRISFACTSRRFRQICLDNRRVLRKVDLSRSMVRREEGPIKKFLTEKLMVQNIRELNLNNQRVMNWRMGAELIEFITHCPQLEALHVLNNGVTLKYLDRILQHAPNLTSLSFSLLDFLSEDVEFLNLCWKFNSGLCLENIKRLNMEISFSALHFKFLKYLLLYRCKCLEELEICIWDMPELAVHDSDLPEYERKGMNADPGLLTRRPQADFLQQFHSLTLRTMLFPGDSRYKLNTPELLDLLISILRMKSREMEWRKLWISPAINCDNLLDKCGLDALASVEVLSANRAFKEDQVKTVFQRMNSGVVKNLQLQNCEWINWMNFLDEFPQSIARIGGTALRYLSLCCVFETHLNARLTFQTLFSACSNVRELDLLGCHFQNNICESLAKLKHLTKIQLSVCAIARDSTNEQMNELLTLVENCPSVTEFYVQGCIVSRCLISRLIADNDLLPLYKWNKLKSFTSIAITKQYNQTSSVMSEKQHKYAFIEQIVENCKLLTTLKIAFEDYDSSYFSKFQSASCLKHLAIALREVNLGKEDFWKCLGYARNLERICIRSPFTGSLSISGAVKMLRQLPRLHVLHVHFNFVENVMDFCRCILEMLEEEKSERSSCFEFFIEEQIHRGQQYCVRKNVLPINVSELCYIRPSMALPVV